MPKQPIISILAPDPPNRTHRINSNSFQQNALTTINGWQYAAFYTDHPSPKTPGALAVNLARRPVGSNKTNHEILKATKWESFAFRDYEQLDDDGHDVISVAVCRGDGTVHVAFDCHCVRLKFRMSKLDIATSPGSHTWSSDLFSEIQDSLSGITSRKELFEEVTYPRFVNVGDDILLSFRIGKAGAGSDILYHYSSQTHTYKFIGQHLTGISNNPYINGQSYSSIPSPGRLHLSWTYRGFVEYEDETAGGIAHKVQAGPNGPENNYDLFYAYSEDFGRMWRGVGGEVVAVLGVGDGDGDGDGMDGSEGSENRVVCGGKGKGKVGNSILPETRGIKVFDIPKGSGILNQEGQCVDGSGGVFVLNRENRSGEERWVVYWKSGGDSESPSPTWHATTLIIPPNIGPAPTETGQRGSIAANSGAGVASNLWIVLQDNTSPTLYILKATVATTGNEGTTGSEEGEEELNWEIYWKGEAFDGEPLIDEERLRDEGVLSVFTRMVAEGGLGTGRSVVVVDFDVRGSRGRVE